MKTQISSDAIDLKLSYVLKFSIFLVTGAMMLAAALLFRNESLSQEPGFIGLSIGSFLLGFVLIVLSNKFVPYCYKIEVDENTIYITKKETIILTEIAKTIEVSKNQLLRIKPSLLGFKIFIWTNDMFYLEFKEETEYGIKIAFLTKMKNSIGGRSFDKLKLLEQNY